MPRSFTKTKEDFACEHCGAKVKGSGFTNHCPRCLWSRHVDVNPGDRLEQCGGMMKPIGVDIKAGEYILIHQCVKCGAKRRNKSSPNDDFDDILKLAQSVAKF